MIGVGTSRGTRMIGVGISRGTALAADRKDPNHARSADSSNAHGTTR
jgi:hypothetical protein